MELQVPGFAWPGLSHCDHLGREETDGKFLSLSLCSSVFQTYSILKMIIMRKEGLTFTATTGERCPEISE